MMTREEVRCRCRSGQRLLTSRRFADTCLPGPRARRRWRSPPRSAIIFDLRKLFALKFWGLVADDGSAIRLTERGRRAVQDGGSHRGERATGGGGDDAPLCRGDRPRRRAQRAGGARLRCRRALAAAFQVRVPVRHSQPPDGLLFPDRRGRRARPPAGRAQGTADALRARRSRGPHLRRRDGRRVGRPRRRSATAADAGEPTIAKRERRVFITHRSGAKIIEQVKELVAFGKFEPVVAKERGAAARPFLHELMDEMRGCDTAVIHVGTEGASSGSPGSAATR